MTPKEIAQAQEANKQVVADKIKAVCDEHGVTLIPQTRLVFEGGQWRDYSAVVVIDAPTEPITSEV